MYVNLPPADPARAARIADIRARHQQLTDALVAEECAAAAHIVRRVTSTDASKLFVERYDDSGEINWESLVVVSRDGEALWFNEHATRVDCWDYPGAEAISDDRGRPYLNLDHQIMNTVLQHLDNAYDAAGGVRGPLDIGYDEHLDGADQLLVLDLEAALAPPAPAPAPAAGDTGCTWIERWLTEGETINSFARVEEGEIGFDLGEGEIIVGPVSQMAEFGHAIVNRVDPPDADTVDAAGLDSSLIGNDGRPYGWKDVALAALARPVTFARYTSDIGEFTAIGGTPEQARRLVIDAWRRNVTYAGADSDELVNEYIEVVTGPVGTVFRDDERLS
ncbi:hypothetical protein [Actinoplanes sp. URMC 104]|uniref:hypothetical protein n=1 Tax=Actinoplanes sp. URMC 104 TaxID=3423409 RepID=UPI003F1A33BC